MVGALAAGGLPAQRGAPELEFRKRSSRLTYGAVGVGKHTLAELPVGGQWRLGRDNASTWFTELPIIAGDRVLPPGEYRVNLDRLDGERCAIRAQGSAHALGGEKATDFQLAGKLSQNPRPTKKLAIDWLVPKPIPKDAHTLGAQLRVRFGEHAWHGAVEVHAHASQKVGKFKLTTFGLPTNVVARREQSAVPIAVVAMGRGRPKENWNLLLRGDEALLVPWMAAPTDYYGFGKIQPPAAERCTTGKLRVEALPEGESVATLELREAAIERGKRGVFTLQFAVGKELLRVEVTAPPKK